MSNDTNMDNHPETPLTARQARRHPSRRIARSPWRAKAKPSSGSPRAPNWLDNPPVRNLFARNDHQNEKGSPQLQTDDQPNKNPRTQRTGGAGREQIGDTGLEPGRKTPEKTRIPESSGAESGAVGGEIGPIEPDLQRIIEVWPRLSEKVKSATLAMIDAAIVR